MAQITWDAAPVIADLRKFTTALKALEAKGAPGGFGSLVFSTDSLVNNFVTATNIVQINSRAASLLDIFESADMPPTAQAVAAANDIAAQATAAKDAWNRFRTTDIPAMNAKLKAAGLTPLEIRK
jgi:hypothetical protein